MLRVTTLWNDLRRDAAVTTAERDAWRARRMMLILVLGGVFWGGFVLVFLGALVYVLIA